MPLPGLTIRYYSRLEHERDNTVADQTVKPAFNLSRFNCPHCGELADQAWFNTYANPIMSPSGVPLRIAGADLERLGKNPQFSPDIREQKLAYWNRVNSGDVFLDRWALIQSDIFIAGMELSACHNCPQVGIWLGGEMVYPAEG